ncbi:PspC domain-containing protein [Nocardioides caeni]|uniref:PspC domain-containing protein n=1 Tax=Nocardioides caeni TaxID=574700 RepID=A0A4S8N3X4_9ACTN|nr:PspC domain-containing protein [Nocardioides caeni]THV10750.1 PspC domain-containing protein [Nocardioides caeni]
MSTPTDTGPDPGHPTGHHGPRVTREEARDLSRLRRSRTDRKVSGVAGGVAQHLDIDPLLVRVAFVVLTFFGGGGLVLYGAAWLLVPEEETEDTVIRVDDNIRTAVLVIAGIIAAASLVGDSVGGFGFPWPLLVVAAVLLVVFGSKEAMKPGGPTHPWLGGPPRTGPAGDVPADGSSGSSGAGGGATYDGYEPGPPPAPRPERRPKAPLLFWWTMALAALLCGVLATLSLAGWDIPEAAYPATVMATCGVMLLVGAFYGRAGGLILVGLLAGALTVAGGVAGDLSDFSVGEVHQTPRTADDVRDESLGVGDMRIDLTRVVDLDELDGRTLELDLRVGSLEVIVPDDGLTVEVDAELQGVGEIKLFGDKADRTDAARHHAGPDAPVLRIDIDGFVGEFVVHTEEDAA